MFEARAIGLYRGLTARAARRISCGLPQNCMAWLCRSDETSTRSFLAAGTNHHLAAKVHKGRIPETLSTALPRNSTPPSGEHLSKPSPTSKVDFQVVRSCSDHKRTSQNDHKKIDILPESCHYSFKQNIKTSTLTAVINTITL